jgi:putative phosphoesterase
VLGDLVAPFVMKQLGTEYPSDVHVVFGNNDGDRHRLVATAAGLERVRVHGEFFRHVLGGRTVIAQHYPSIADVIDSSAADLVAFGHDHRARCSRRGDAWFVNPGALMGYDPLVEAEVPSSWAVYDSGAHAVAFWRLEGDGVQRWEIPGLPPAPPATS